MTAEQLAEPIEMAFPCLSPRSLAMFETCVDHLSSGRLTDNRGLIRLTVASNVLALSRTVPGFLAGLLSVANFLGIDEVHDLIIDAVTEMVCDPMLSTADLRLLLGEPADAEACGPVDEQVAPLVEYMLATDAMSTTDRSEYVEVKSRKRKGTGAQRD